MLSEELLETLNTFLTVGIVCGIVFLLFVFVGGLVLFVVSDFRSSKLDKDDLEELEEKLILEIRKAKDKELSAKDCALMNIESDIKYIREKFKENKK
mgnify:CR=1 FL=1